MQRKTFTRTLLAAAALAVALPGLAQAQAMKLTLGHGAAPGNPRHEAAVKFAETLKAKTAGRIEVQVAPSAQLGDDAAMVTAVRTGALDMTANSQGAVSVAVPEYAAYGMPFMFSTPAQAFKLLDGPLGQELAQKSADKGMVVLGYWDNGIRHMTNSKRDVKEPGDLKGLKMRTMENPVHIAAYKGFGIITTPMAFPEVFTALQQGTVDGQENPLPVIISAKFDQVQKHLTLTGHVYSPCIFVMNKAAFDKLSAADKQAFIDAAKEGTKANRARVDEDDAKGVADLRAKGMTVVDNPDKAKFVAALAPVNAEFEKQFGKATLDKIRAVK